MNEELEHSYRERLQAIANAYPLIAHTLLVHKTIRRQPLTLSDAPYLVEPLRDFTSIEGADMMKSVQTRWTELLLQFAFLSAGEMGRHVAYVVPTARDRNLFVQRRVDPLLTSVPLYRSWLPRNIEIDEEERELATSAENLSLKHLGHKGGLLMFLGANVASHFVEWSADVSIVDELDHCSEENLVLLPDRLKASKVPQSFRAGNPTRPGVGIARAYDQGDRRKWLRKCEHCGQWQALDWFRHVVRRDDAGQWRPRDTEGLQAVERGDEGADIRPMCVRCQRPMMRGREAVAAWVPEFHKAKRPRRSYHVSRLDVQSEKLIGLFLEWLQAQGDPFLTRRFHNSNLGLPWQAEGEGIDDALIDRICAGAENGSELGQLEGRTVLAGVDVGAVLHVDIGILEALPPNDLERTLIARLALSGGGADAAYQARMKRTRRRTIWVGTVPSFEVLDDVLKRWKVRLCAIDQAPEYHEVRKLRERAAGYGVAIHPVGFFPQDRLGVEAFALQQDTETAKAIVDRTQVFDAVLEELIDGRAVYPRDAKFVEQWAEQMKAPKRVLDPKKGRYIWDEGGKPDHYRLAGVYLRVAQELYQSGAVVA